FEWMLVGRPPRHRGGARTLSAACAARGHHALRAGECAAGAGESPLAAVATTYEQEGLGRRDDGSACARHPRREPARDVEATEVSNVVEFSHPSARRRRPLRTPVRAGIIVGIPTNGPDPIRLTAIVKRFRQKRN